MPTRRRRTRPLLLAALTVVVLLAFAAGAWLLLGERVDGAPPDDHIDEEEPSLGVPDEEPPQELPEARTYESDPEAAGSVAAMLAGIDGDADVVANLAPGTRESLDPASADVAAGLPPGVVLQPQPETWVRRGNLGAMYVEVVHPDRQEVDTFLVWVLRETVTDTWLISSTEPVSASQIPDEG